MSKRTPILLDQAEREAEETTPKESAITKASREFSSAAESEETFLKLKEKLLYFERWNDEAGLSSYELFDAEGNRKGDKQAVIGDFMKISLPASGKDDWV